MNDLSDENLLERVLSQPRLTRSISESKIFCKLNDKNKPEIVGALNVNILSFLIEFEEVNKNFDQITDDKERAEAYRELCQQLDNIIKNEKKDNLKNLHENSKFIREQQAHIEKLEQELLSKNEQILNSKELINQFSNEKIALTQSIEKLKEESKRVNAQTEKIQQLFEGFDLEILSETITKISREYAESNDQDLNQTVNDLVTDINTLKPAFSQAQNFINNSKMQVEAKDVIAGIPMFSGDVKLLDGFLNAADLYYSLVEENQKATVLKIIKAKITGEALSKAGPFGDELNTWALLKKRIKEKVKKPISLEYAQEDLNQVFQKKDESIEDYGARVKSKLKKLNEASKPLSDSIEQRKVLQKMNEKQAISKFEQNIRDTTIKVLVSAAGKSTLDECITFAMQKELTEKNKNIKFCTLCGLSDHNEKTCNNRKKDGNLGENFNRKKFGNGQQNRNFNRSNQNYDQKQFPSSSKNEQKTPNTGFSPNYQKNRSADFQRSKHDSNGNEKTNKNQKSVKLVNEDESSDITTVKEALKEAENAKN